MFIRRRYVCSTARYNTVDPDCTLLMDDLLSTVLYLKRGHGGTGVHDSHRIVVVAVQDGNKMRESVGQGSHNHVVIPREVIYISTPFFANPTHIIPE